MYIRLVVALLVIGAAAGSGVGTRHKEMELSASMSVNVSLEVELSDNEKDLSGPDANGTTLKTIIVGADGSDVFQPSHVTASLGDIVRFQFLASSNHTVTQSSFEYPCVPSGSFDTEYLTADNETIEFVVTTTAP